MRSISAISSSWQTQLPRAIGPGRTDVLAPVAPVRPSRHDPRETAVPLNERVLSGEYISTKAATAIPPVDFNRQVFETLAKAVDTESEAANAGLAIKAVHAYLLAGTPTDMATGLRVDGYA